MPVASATPDEPLATMAEAWARAAADLDADPSLDAPQLLAQLAEEREAYHTAPVLFCTVDADSLRVVHCNRTLLECLGRSPEEVLDQPLTHFVPVEELDCLQDWLAALAANKPHPDQDFHLGAQDRYLVVRLSGRVDRRPDRPTRLRLAFVDASKERRLEAQLVQAQRMEAVGRLAGGVAHDFNNLLSVITACAAFLEPALDDPACVRDVHDIQEAARRGSELTHHLLAFSRQQMVTVEVVQLHEVLTHHQDVLKRVLSDAVELGVDFAEGLFVRLDPPKFEQVLLNLVINAQDAMPAGGHLTLTAARVDWPEDAGAHHLPLAAGPYARLAVRDTGVGMPPEVRAHVFEPFFSTKKRSRGTGLGLSMCYGIVRQHGGGIAVESEVGRGSTFFVYLPLVDATAPRGASAPPAPPRGPDGRGEVVLLVEDDDAVRRVAARALGEARYSVIEARDGAEALERAREQLHDLSLVVTDVVMPRLGGPELVASLRQLRPDLRVLYTSGYAGSARPERARYLAKPFTPADLRIAVRDALEGAAT